MSILIKGMEMPKCCDECALLYDAMCCIVTTTSLWSYPAHEHIIDSSEERLPDCPLIEIPDGHGRLIDADELKNDIHYTDDFYETPFVWWDDILESPTVIPADKGGET